MAITSRLRDSVTISRWVAGAADAWNRTGQSHVDDAFQTKANVQVRRGRVVRGPDLDAVAISDALIFLPIGATIGTRDLIRHGGATYRCLAAPRNAGGRGRHLEIDAQRIVP